MDPKHNGPPGGKRAPGGPVETGSPPKPAEGGADASGLPGLGWSDDRLREFLQESTRRHEMILTVMGYLGSFYPRRLAFFVRDKVLYGYAAQPSSNLAIPIKELRAAADDESGLGRVLVGGTYFFGRPESAGLDVLYNKLGLSVPPDSCVIPIQLGGHVAALIAADGETEALDATALPRSFIAVKQLAAGLERLIRQIRASEPEPAEEPPSSGAYGRTGSRRSTQRLGEVRPENTYHASAGWNQETEIVVIPSFSLSGESLALEDSGWDTFFEDDFDPDADPASLSDLGSGALWSPPGASRERDLPAPPVPEPERYEPGPSDSALPFRRPPVDVDEAERLQSDPRRLDGPRNTLPGIQSGAQPRVTAPTPVARIAERSSQAAEDGSGDFSNEAFKAGDTLVGVRVAPPVEEAASMPANETLQGLRIGRASHVTTQPLEPRQAEPAPAPPPVTDRYLPPSAAPTLPMGAVIDSVTAEDSGFQRTPTVPFGMLPGGTRPMAASTLSGPAVTGPMFRVTGLVEPITAPTLGTMIFWRTERALQERTLIRLEPVSLDLEIPGVLQGANPLSFPPHVSEVLENASADRVVELLASDDQALVHGASLALLNLGMDALSSMLAAFPGPLYLDRQEPESTAQPVEKHGPLLAAFALQLQSFFPYLEGLSRSENPDARYYACRLLALCTWPELIDILIARLFDDDLQTRELAIHIVEQKLLQGGASREHLFSQVRAALESPESWVVEHAIALVRRLGDPRTADLLIGHLDSSSARIRQKAAATLSALTFQDFGEDARAWQNWFAKHGNDGLKTWLIDAMGSGKRPVRENAARAIRANPRLAVNYHADLDRGARDAAIRTVYHALFGRPGP